MNISEAVERAIIEECCITVPNMKGIAKIKPTNGKENCIVMSTDGSNPSKRGWQPSANDLVRTDWELTD